MTPMGPYDNSQSDSKSSRWYYFRDGGITGPTGLDGVLELEPQGKDGKDTLVCRADFKKWYPLGELAHLLKAQDLGRRDASHEKEHFKTTVTRHLETLETLRAQTSSVEPKVVAEAEPLAAKPKSAPYVSPKTAVPEGPLGYYLLKGRLRLGVMRRPFVTAFLTGPLTLGIAWFVWLKTAFMELRWHASHDFNFHKLRVPLLLVLIPGFQIYFVWQLALLLRTIENQNSYQKTSPLVATLLSVVPPLAICYLQTRINLHWKMHVNHYLKTQTQSG